ncbi:MAG: response regulator transcription factor [Flavobacteriales bacterium]|nr:MAG: response regulator transcription factor [Flavobacteriales bacterium]MCL4856665.1 response regulator transcription factor [Flavobacteriales bacterium]
MQSKIVVVSKFRQNADDLKSLFLKEGFEVFSVSEPTSSNIELINNLSPDVVFLELEHGGFDAIDLCYQLKKEKKMNGFVVIYSSQHEEYVQLEAYKVGADDFILKPINNRLLSKKISALIKHTNPLKGISKSNTIVFNNIVIDRESYTIMRGTEKIELPKKEFELLYLLFKNPQKIYTRNEIYKSVWDNLDNYNPRIIDVHVRKIREKVGDTLINTVKGVGYQLAKPGY